MTPRIAFVHDWLAVPAGSEKVLEAMLALHPGAPVYTLVYQPERYARSEIARHPVHTSFIQRLPKGSQKYRSYLPLMPLAVEQFDLSAYDIVVSSSHAVAKGVLTRADQRHIAYVHTPMRYTWDLYFQYLRESGLDRGLTGWATRAALHYLRLWDLAAAARPDVLVANSRYVAQRIRKLYRRRARVIYPPVDVDRFSPTAARADFYLTVSRMVPYKRIDLIVESFSRLGLPLVVIGDGPEAAKVRRLAGPTVTLLGYQDDAVTRTHLERCKAFVFAADEDFGIVPVEAQAAGAPVIAYGAGGATETVVDRATGLFFPEQTVASLIAAVQAFQSGRHRLDTARIRANAERFSTDRFQQHFSALVEGEQRRHTRRTLVEAGR